jgi:hypothetical protein
MRISRLAVFFTVLVTSVWIGLLIWALSILLGVRS